MWETVVLRWECRILLLSCQRNLKHPHFGSLRRQRAAVCWMMSRCPLAMEGTLPLLSQQSCRGFNSSWKFYGREQRQGGTFHIIKRCRGQGAEGDIEAKLEWATMRYIGLEMCRNPGFLIVLYNLFITALWCVQGSPSVTNDRQRLLLGGQTSGFMHSNLWRWPSPAWLPPASLPQTCSRHSLFKISPWYIIFLVRVFTVSFLSTDTLTPFVHCRQHTAE